MGGSGRWRDSSEGERTSDKGDDDDGGGDSLTSCRGRQEFVWALASFSLCSALGQCFIYYTIAEFSPLLLATVTTTRKIFSTLVSVFRDPSAPDD